MSLCHPLEPPRTTLDIGLRWATSIQLQPYGTNGVGSMKWKAVTPSGDPWGREGATVAPTRVVLTAPGLDLPPTDAGRNIPLRFPR
jgi:hypothetical protein